MNPTDLLLQVQNEDYWQSSVSVFKQAVVPADRPTQYVPIPDFELPIIFTSRLLAISTFSLIAPPRWWLGARVRPIIDVPGLVSTVGGDQARIPVNRGSQLVVFPQWANQFKLEVNVPWWHKELRIDVFEYIGPISSQVQQLVEESRDTIRIDLVRIERRLQWMADQ